jgi:hypothetical protein
MDSLKSPSHRKSHDANRSYLPLKNGESLFELFPAETTARVFEKLELRDRINVAQVCTTFRDRAEIEKYTGLEALAVIQKIEGVQIAATRKSMFDKALSLMQVVARSPEQMKLERNVGIINKLISSIPVVRGAEIGKRLEILLDLTVTLRRKDANLVLSNLLLKAAYFSGSNFKVWETAIKQLESRTNKGSCTRGDKLVQDFIGSLQHVGLANLHRCITPVIKACARMEASTRAQILHQLSNKIVYLMTQKATCFVSIAKAGHDLPEPEKSKHCWNMIMTLTALKEEYLEGLQAILETCANSSVHDRHGTYLLLLSNTRSKAPDLLKQVVNLIETACADFDKDDSEQNFAFILTLYR